VVTVSIDGVIVPPEQATVSIFDRGFQHGDGLFETFRTWDGVAVSWPEHEARLRRSAAALQLPVGAIEVNPPIVAAGAGEHRVKVIVTRGGRTIVIVEPLGPLPTEVTAAVVDLPLARRREGHKTLAYLENLLARDLAASAGAQEAIRLDADGLVAEGAMSNVFIVDGDEVVTPPAGNGLLPGITRAHVLAIGARERRITTRELREAEEIFVTSAVRGIVAVTRLDGEPRVAGPVSMRIANMYGREMRQRAHGSVV
jgi:branched-subunit amino acid aminotransferase/4-amino-4-deoxychorismate lyase